MASFSGLQIDTVSPTVIADISSPGSGVENVGDRIGIALSFSEAVTIKGLRPSLILNNGGVAHYLSGAGTTNLTFRYTVASTDASVAALAVKGVSGVIQDLAGNVADMTGALTTFDQLSIDTTTIPTTFGDSFSPPSTGWSNSVGQWTASNGDYFAENPSDSPLTYSGLPFDFANSRLALTVTVNALGDGGIWLDTDGTNQNGLLLVLGGNGYGQGSRGGTAGNGAYWQRVQNGVISDEFNLQTGVFTPGGTYTVTVGVNGNTYVAYDDPDGVYDANSKVLTTLTDGTFSHGMVGLYDDQPNNIGGGFGPPTSFSNFSVSGALLGQYLSTFNPSNSSTSFLPSSDDHNGNNEGTLIPIGVPTAH
jgi:hypothetical protein